MLFSRVYNWIKYKTLPPSVLFLNRLYVERDSKHRRATSNLGLTFRNSKWSTYARTNINLNSKTNYIWLLLRTIGIVFLVIAVLNFSTFYNYSSAAAPLYSIVWFIFDADLYLKAAVSSSLLCSAQLALSSLFSRFMSFSATTSLNVSSVSDTEFQVPKRLHKPVLYKWLTTSQNSKTDISNIFEPMVNSSHVTELGHLYKHLYTTSNLLQRSADNFNDLKSNVSITSSSSNNVNSFLANFSQDASPRLNLIALETLLFANSEKLKSPMSMTSQWTLNSIHAELASNQLLAANLNGLFYLPSVSYTRLNSLIYNTPELSLLATSVNNQLSTIRWQRWLYKYNILHRSSLTAANHLNSAKSLISSGFYSSTLTTRNIWAASTFGNQVNTSSFRDLYDNLYGDVFSASRLGVDGLTNAAASFNTSSMNLFGFYESSYYWFIQRFYQYNTLASNSTVLKPQVPSNELSFLNSAVSEFNSATTELNTASQSFVRLPSSSLSTSTLSTDTTLSLKSTSSDVYLNYYDYTLFSKTRVELMNNLLMNRSQQIVYFYSHTL